MTGHSIGVGSLNMDLVVRAPRHPQVGKTILEGQVALTSVYYVR